MWFVVDYYFFFILFFQDKIDGSTSVCNNMYDSTHAYAALNNPMAKYKNVAIGIPLVNLVSKDIANFPGPASYKLKPTVNAITAGGYMLPHESDGKNTVPRIRKSLIFFSFK